MEPRHRDQDAEVCLVDTDVLVELTGHPVNAPNPFLDGLAAGYARHAQTLLAELSDAAAQDDRGRAARAIHSLKGTGGILGARAVFDECVRMEDALRCSEKDWRTGLERLRVLAAATHLALAALRQDTSTG